jgi:cysteine synthase
MPRHDMKPWLARLAASTPAVPLDDPETGCTIWLKLEYLLPSGSTKDRLAAFVLSHAIETGALREDGIVVEASSGSTSIAFALACAMVGVRFVAVMPEGVSDERVLIIRRYGGDVVLTPAQDGVMGAIERTRAMAEGDDRVFLPRQFENVLNVLVHQRATGPELIASVGGTIHGFTAGVGTGGTLMGVARALREAGHPTRIARAHPEHGVCFEGEPEICGGIPGVVDGLSSLFDPKAVGLDADVPVTDSAAYAAARALCARGFPVGPSSGLNFAAARALAGRLGPGHTIATVLCDRMERYFSTDLFGDLKTRSA